MLTSEISYQPSDFGGTTVKAPSQKPQDHVAQREGKGSGNKAYFGIFKVNTALLEHLYLQRFYLYEGDQIPFVSQMHERRCMPVLNEQLLDNLVKALIDAVNNNDTSRAERLISIYGAKELARYRCSFSFEDKTYPDITPFALACRFGQLALAKGLYANQEQVNQAFHCENGTHGRTALMLAVMYGHIDVVKQLLGWGADTEILDDHGMVVDEINLAFNEGAKQALISNLLREYREQRNYEQFKKPDFCTYFIKGVLGMGLYVNPESLDNFLDNILNPDKFIYVNCKLKPRPGSVGS